MKKKEYLESKSNNKRKMQKSSKSCLHNLILPLLPPSHHLCLKCLSQIANFDSLYSYIYLSKFGFGEGKWYKDDEIYLKKMNKFTYKVRITKILVLSVFQYEVKHRRGACFATGPCIQEVLSVGSCWARRKSTWLTTFCMYYIMVTKVCVCVCARVCMWVCVRACELEKTLKFRGMP